MKKYTFHFAVLIFFSLLIPCVANDFADHHNVTFTFPDGSKKTFFDVAFWHKDKFNDFPLLQHLNDDEPMPFDFESELKKPTLTGLEYWSDILGTGAKNNKPVYILVNTEDNANASAISYEVHWPGEDEDLIPDGIKNVIINGEGKDHIDFEEFLVNEDKTASSTSALANISIGKFLGAKRDGATLGWWVDSDTLLPTNEQACDYIAAVRHEMGHALGICAKSEDLETPLEIGGVEYALKEIVTDDENSWNTHLYDQTGKRAQNGMKIMTSDMLDEWNDKNPGDQLTENDVFLLDDGKLADFRGEHVSEVLNGAKFNINGQNFSGLPVNGWEFTGYDCKGIELSHFQTSGMMSHEYFSNYTTFLEVELAAMQDLGYELDRKNLYGFSVYGNGNTITNNNGYFARNASGTDYLQGVFNTTPLGIGLHIYGERNNVTQAADILTSGTGSAGIRIDGTENTVTIANGTKIQSDGYRGIGALVAYGKGQTLNVNGTLTANGEGGNAIQIDFGSSKNGGLDDYRGSYIRYSRVIDKDGNITKSVNMKFEKPDNTPIERVTVYLDGEMVKELNINGAVSGKENAILISKNAFVKDINIGSGATLRGNITNNWKHFSVQDDPNNASYNFEYVENVSESICIRYNNSLYAYEDYIPDLITNINIKNNLVYSGNITGRDNTKINVTGGTLAFTGTADVVNVKVAEGASLLGGNYKLNNMGAKIASGMSDSETGTLYNRGTIGALVYPSEADTDNEKSTKINVLPIKINGTLDTKDGALYFTGLDEGKISVENGSVIGTDNAKIAYDKSLFYIPGKTYDGEFLIGTNENGEKITLQKAWENSSEFSALLTLKYDNGKVSTKITNNLKNTTSRQNETFKQMENMYNSFGTGNVADKNRFQMAMLFNLESDKDAKSALDDISGQELVGLYGTVQRQGYAENLIRKHFGEITSTKNGKHTVWFGLEPLIRKENIEIESKNFALYTATGTNFAFSNGFTVGGFFAGGWNKYKSGKTKNNACDLRFGADFTWQAEHNIHSAFSYFDYGLQINNTEREISVLELSGDANYTTHLFELGGEYKFNIIAATTGGKSNWNIAPYIGTRLSVLLQPSYEESGFDIYSMENETTSNFYANIASGLSVGYDTGIFGIFARTGATFVPTNITKVKFNYSGNPSQTYTNEAEHDVVLASFGLSGYGSLKSDLSVQGSVDAETSGNTWQICGKISIEKKFPTI